MSMRESKSITRRDFLKGAGAVAALEAERYVG